MKFTTLFKAILPNNPTLREKLEMEAEKLEMRNRTITFYGVIFQ